MEKLGVESAIERPLVRRHQPLLEQAVREDLGVFVPCAIEDPASSESTHAAHAGETCGQIVELQMEPVRAHLLRAAVKALEPRILGVGAFERDLQTKARREGARQRCLSSANHSRDANQHGAQPKSEGCVAKWLFFARDCVY